MKYKVYESNQKVLDKYTVIFPDGIVYTMSFNANSPQGVCTCFPSLDGNNEDFIEDLLCDGCLIEDESLIPLGVKIQINNINNILRV